MRFMNDLDARLGAHSSPATTRELVDAHGDLVLDLSNGTEIFGEDGHDRVSL